MSRAELLTFLTPSEKQEYENRSLKKRDEWLLGRVAAKRVFQKSLGSEPGGVCAPTDITIKYTDLGAPYYDFVPSGTHDKTLNLSISHAYPYGLAVASTEPVGGDVERIRSFSPIFRTKLLTEEEERWIDQSPEDGRDFLSTVLWSLKEAVLKAEGVGLRVHPKQVRVLLSEESGGRALCYYGSGGVYVGEWHRLGETHLMATVIRKNFLYV